MRNICILLICFALVSCSAQNMKRSAYRVSIPHAEEFEDSGTRFDAEDFEWIDTPESTCFEYIGYSYGKEQLCVCFRDSGAVYVYTDVPEDVFEELFGANSKGGYYNSAIKGQYNCEKTRSAKSQKEGDNP